MPVKSTITDAMNDEPFGYDTPDWPAPKCVKALTTWRPGGVSEDNYASLNLGDHVGDRAALVERNRQKLRAQLDLQTEPVWLNQVHGTNLVDLRDDALDQSTLLSADGAITSAGKGVAAIMTADCMPVFICDTAGEQVGLVHAGWRGLAAGIVEAAISLINVKTSDIVVWAGPSIGPQHFEIGADVRVQLGGSDSCYQAHVDPNKYYADLYLLLGERMRALKVGDYSHSQACTYRDEARYFSYRRDGQCGRMASLIWVEE